MKQRILRIIEQGENERTEFKESFDPKNLSKEIVAFANASGGKIYLGIADDGKIIGVKIVNKLKSNIQDVANNCDPSVKIKLDEFENILIIKIKQGTDKPYKCSSGFYLRQGANSQKMSRDEILDFAIGEGKIKFDEQINDRFDFKKDFDREKLNNYLTRAGLSKLIPTKNILKDLGVGDGNFNNAGVLFFAKNPQQFISHSVFTCVLFRDKKGSDIIDRQEIGGNLIQIIEEVMKFIEKNTRVAYKFTGKPQRENVYEYPLEAIREAVINSVMHRDYFESGHNNILRIFPDKLTITNVWLQPSWFKLGRDTFRRNKIIANLFLRIGFIEKIGTGFERMRNFCREVRARIFNLDIDEKYFRIEFFKSKNYLELAEEKVVRKSGQKRWSELTEKQRIILRIIKENPKISRKELVKKLSINPSAVQKRMEKLKQKGLLKRIGSARSGCWEIEE